MNISKTYLEREATSTLQTLERLHQSIKAEATAMGVAETDLRTVDGAWPMLTLMAAKAECLSVLTNLKVNKEK